MSQRWQPAPYRAPGGTQFLHDPASDRLLILGAEGTEVVLPVTDLVAFLDRRGDPRAALAGRPRGEEPPAPSRSRPQRSPH